jgi:hypothetical protein
VVSNVSRPAAPYDRQQQLCEHDVHRDIASPPSPPFFNPCSSVRVLSPSTSFLNIREYRHDEGALQQRPSSLISFPLHPGSLSCPHAYLIVWKCLEEKKYFEKMDESTDFTMRPRPADKNVRASAIRMQAKDKIFEIL